MYIYTHTRAYMWSRRKRAPPSQVHRHESGRLHRQERWLGRLAAARWQPSAQLGPMKLRDVLRALLCFMGRHLLYTQIYIYIYVYMSIFVTYIYIYICIYILYLYLDRCIHVSSNLFIYLVISLFLYLSFYLSVCLSVCLSVYLSISLFMASCRGCC